MVKITHAASPSEIAGVQDLIREFTSWAFSLHDDAREFPTFSGLEAELAALPGKYAPPTGCLLLACVDGQPTGCVAVRKHDDTTAEVKRMYVLPSARGLGVGTALIDELIAATRRMGYGRMVLTTHPLLESAIRLYQVAGFEIVHNPPNFPDYEGSEVCMEKLFQ